MAKTKKKEVQKQGLRPSQKAKAEKLRQKQEAKKAAAALLVGGVNEAQKVVPTSETISEPVLTSVVEKKSGVQRTIRLTKDKKIVRKIASVVKEKKTTRTTTKKASAKEETTTSEKIADNNLPNMEPIATIKVKNAEGDPDTVAEILIQNKIDYTPKVSVIMPVYNVELYLRQCLDSVINQTLKEIEIICVDDGSTDASLDILKEYAAKDNRITVITQKNLHAGVARNAGLSQAKGEYIHFLDSDDWIDINTYGKLYEFIKEQNADVLKFCSYSYDNKQQKVVNSYFTSMGALKDEEFENFLSLKNNCQSIINVSDAPWSGIYKTKFIKENNILFDNLLCANDTSFFYRCIVNSKNIYLTRKRFVYYRINNSSSLIGIRAYNFDCQIRQFFTIMNIIKSCNKNIIYVVRKHLIHSLFYRYVNYINNPLLEKIAKDKIRKEMKEFCTHVGEYEIPDEYIAYYKDVKSSIKVSVIIPVYNAEQYLEECLNSLIGQTLKEMEIICVNDCSTDNSLKILKRYKANDNRIKIINLEKNTGAPGAVKNIGMKYATGNYIGVLDSDDYVDDNYFNELYTLAVKNDADISATKSIIRFSEKTSVRNFINCQSDMLVGASQKQELMKKSGSNWNKIYRKSMLDKYSIRCYEKRNVAEDNYFSMTAMSVANKIVLTDKVSYHYRRHENSVTSEKRSKKDFLIFDVYELIEKQISNISNKDEISSYIEAVRARELQDFTWFRDDCKEEDFPLFKRELKSRFPHIYDRICHDDTIIVSLTSYPARITTVNQTIETLLNQSMKADKVILWLAPEQFPNKEADLPQELLDLREKGLTIDWYRDIRSYKKLIPTLKKYPEAVVVTADDDLLFDKDWLYLLYRSYVEYPHFVHCHRITRVYEYADGSLKILPRNLYLDENKKYIKELCQPSAFNKLSGGAGTLFPPHCFTEDICNEELFMKLAPTSDDIWFWLMALLNGYKVRVVDDNLYELNYVENTQDCGLTNINDINENKVFYEHLNNIITNFPTLNGILGDDMGGNNRIISKIYDKKMSIQANNLSRWYKRVTGKYLNLNNPKTFNEKIQWMKLYNSTPIKTLLADKYKARNWVKEKIGEQYLIPLLGVYDKFEDIDFNELPEKFVIKCNHGCAYNIIVKDKSQLDLNDTKEKLDKWMAEDFSNQDMCELHYKHIPHKIIIEQFIENKNSDDLNDYKFYCFNGDVKYIQVISERINGTHKVSFYDTNWKKQSWWDNVFYKGQVEKPKKLNEMLELAKKMCQGFNFVRVDLYYLDTNEIYFGEMTFTPSSGSMKWSSESINKKLGAMIKLPAIAYNIDTGNYYKIPKINFIKAWLLLPYYLYKITKMKKKYMRANNQIFKDILKSYRIDVKNVGTKENTTEILGQEAIVSEARWLTDDKGIGKIINFKDGGKSIKMKIVGSGILKLIFRGQEKKYNDKRYPLWVDFKSIKIDGKEILSVPTSVWHDKPFKYEMSVKNGQEITITAETICHNYTQEELYEIARVMQINVNSFMIQNILTEIKNDQRDNNNYWKNNVYANILSMLTSYRLDIKNVGNETNNISVTGENISVNDITWNTSQGGGKIIQGNGLFNVVRLKAINNGYLRIDFKGQDKRYNDKRYPLWIDYKSIKINGNEILSVPISVWHDRPFKYEMSVKNGQELILEIEQQYHRYKEDELKDILLKLNSNNDYIRANINNITEYIADRTNSVLNEVNIEACPAIKSESFVPLNIYADCYTQNSSENSLVEWLDKYGLRVCNLPFDKINCFMLKTILDTIKYGVANWLDLYIETETKYSKDFRCIIDTSNKLEFNKDFPKNKKMEESLLEVKNKYSLYYKNLLDLLSKSTNICFVCNSQLDVKNDFIQFLSELKKIYSDKSFMLLNIRNNSTEQRITEYKLGRNIIVYDFETDKENEASVWTTVFSNLSLSSKAKIGFEKENKDYAA